MSAVTALWCGADGRHAVLWQPCRSACCSFVRLLMPPASTLVTSLPCWLISLFTPSSLPQLHHLTAAVHGQGQPQRRHRGNSPPKQRLRQPVCPPTKNARGFAAGRGRAAAPPASSAPGAPNAQAPGQAPKPAPPFSAPVPVAKSQAQQASPAPAQLSSSPPGIPHGFPPGVPQAPGPVPLPPTAQPTFTGRQGSPFPAAPEAQQAPSAGHDRVEAEGSAAAQSPSSAPTAEASADRPTRGWMPDADQVRLRAQKRHAVSSQVCSALFDASCA